jgi:ribonuclease HI
MKNKYYVVWAGHHPGVYETWMECKHQIDGFNGAVYKSFPTKELAETAFADSPKKYLGQDMRPAAMSKLEKELIGMPILDSIAVDAACSGNPGDLEFRCVHVKSKKILFQRGVYPNGTVNIGEFLALVLGLIYLNKNKLTIPIYTDSKTAITWVKNKKAKTKLECTPENEELFLMIQKAENWLKTNTFNNKILKWETACWGEIPADYNRK